MKVLASPVVWVSCVLFVGMLGTALISPLYPLYAQDWGLGAAQVSWLYVLYMLAALAALLMLGRLSDRLGFRRVLAASLVLSVVGSAISLAAGGVVVLVLGRMLVGVSSSLATTAGAAALRQVLGPRWLPHLPLIYNMVLALGFGMGPFLGGLIGQFSGRPLVEAYWPPLALGCLALAGLLAFVPETLAKPLPVRVSDVMPRFTLPPAGQRAGFLVACCGTFLCFSVFGLYATMVPLFVEDLMHVRGPLVAGVSIAVIFLISALTQLALQRHPAGAVFRAGLISFAVCALALWVNLHVNAPWLFILGVAITSVGHGMLLFGSMSMVNRAANTANQAGLTAAYMVAGYVGAVSSSLLTGWAADAFGMVAGVSGFCIGTIVMALGVAVISWWRAD